jgi:hypothetical protein
MTSVNNAGSTPRTVKADTSLYIGEAALTKNQALIEKTVNQALSDIDKAVKSLKTLAENSFSGTSATGSGSQGIAAGPGGCFPTEAPSTDDLFRPADKLKVDSNGTITTPGGYKIEQLGQFEWKISGPDGKSTRVWGDPHVDESDGGKFDFKKNTTFALPDGTQIHVTTKPWGNSGMTVTGQLDITCGDDRITVSDIDKGKGKVGTIEKDGHTANVKFAEANGGLWDTSNYLRMGKETDDWVHQGKEIIGDHNGGESFKHGKEMEVGHWQGAFGKIDEKKPDDTKPATNKPTTTPPRQDPTKARDELLKKIMDGLNRVFDQLLNTRPFGHHPFRPRDDFGRYDRNEHRHGINEAFRSVRTMFRALDQINRLNDMVNRRNIFF